MKITDVQTIVTKGIGKPWIFCIIRTDAGITGYSEFGFGGLPNGLVGLVEDFKPHLIGKDPLPVERRYAELRAFAEYTAGGATQKALAGIELALWDIKGKEANKSVAELLGGPTKDSQHVYWSHLITYPANFADEMQVPPVNSWEDIRRCTREAVDAGYDAVKTNFVFPGMNDQQRRAMMTRPGLAVSAELLDHIEKQIGLMREEGGPELGIALDINKNFRPEAQIQIARRLEPFNLMWLEIDNPDPVSLRQVRDATTSTILTGEALLGVEQYRSFLEHGSMAIGKFDMQWQGLISSRQIALMADAFQINVVPHNFNGHLSTFQSLNLCASVTNAKSMETDPISAVFRDDLFTNVPVVENGYAQIPAGPGWGTELNEDLAEKLRLN